MRLSDLLGYARGGRVTIHLAGVFLTDFLMRLRWPALLAALLCCSWASVAGADASAEPISVLSPPAGSLGRHLLVHEETEPLSLAEIRALARGGEMGGINEPVPALGIGSRPVWFYLPVENPADTPQHAVLVAGAAWIDRIDVYIVQEADNSSPGVAAGQMVHLVGGDREAGFIRPVPGLGYLFAHDFAPGRSGIVIRAESPDPMLLPVRLKTGQALTEEIRVTQYSYGLLYGFLLALFAYNLMLYIGIRQRSHLYYSVYLALFILMNLAYTGHGYAWFWPSAQGFQQYVILVLMVLFACAGFRFARVFLNLAELSRRLDKAVVWCCRSAVALMAVFVLVDAQAAAAWLSFAFLLAFTFSMVGLGYYAVRHQSVAGKYFLAAVCSGMVGVGVTTVTVWGWVPYHVLGFRAVEIGIVIEATLLALAVAYLVRQHEAARHQAEMLAGTDPLTGLMNRRAFGEQAETLWNTASRHQRPLALVLFDIDHFKNINDRYGHVAGDKVLVEAAKLIRRICRQGDLPARWGGEEFVLLLPESSLEQAVIVAERLREQFASREVWVKGLSIELRASFGVVERDNEASLSELIEKADSWLYQAKSEGRDRICGPGLLHRY